MHHRENTYRCVRTDSRRASNVLLTGAYGRVGTAFLEPLADREACDVTYLDREAHPDHETVVADVTDCGAIRPAFDGQDAVVHLAGYPETDIEEWDAPSGGAPRITRSSARRWPRR